MKARENSLWRNLYEGLVVGRPESEYQLQRREDFLREFADRPEAEFIRVWFRILVFLVVMGPMLAMAVISPILLLAGQRIPSFWSDSFEWLITINLFSAAIMPNCDNLFVRVIMKRRARLEARSQPRFAERLLWFYLPSETADEAIEHLNAKFEAKKERLGTGKARRWYAFQVVRSCFPLLDQFIERLMLWGL